MRSRRVLVIVLIAVVFLPLILTMLPNFVTNWFWFDSVEYLGVFKTRLFAGLIAGLVGFVMSALWLGGNLLVANRLTGRYPVARPMNDRLNINIRDQILAVGWMGTLFVALVAALAVGGQWETALRFLNASQFGVTDPVFGNDIGYYIFRWPFLQLVANWWLWLVGLAFVGAGLIHAGDQIQSRRIQLEPSALIHLTVLAAIFLGVKAWDYQLQKYDVLYSVHGALTGAGFTDLKVRMPAYTALSIILGTAAVLVLANIYLRKTWPVWVPLVIWLVTSFLMLDVAPSIVQRLLVTPDELTQERPYIARSIEFTRKAYGLDAIEDIPFTGTQSLSFEDVQTNQDTLINVRLWDWQPLQRTYGQLQEIRTYYEFGDVDVERYELAGGIRSVMLAAREMRTDQLTEQAKTWLNQHLIYTHGHGVVLNAVNEVTEDGLPNLLVRDIPPRASEPALEITRPEIYFGEEGGDYVIVGTMEDELDYPKGETNVYTRYEGRAGVQLTNIFRRLAFSLEFGDLPVLISRSITRDSRILMNRNIQDRIGMVAPFLWLDNDPYMVIADGRLYWFQDAYTYSDRYPYSDHIDLPGRSVNYVRNSVKIVVDAYNGDITFYRVDDADPILATYERIYEKLFTPYDQMPESLQKHIRYPQDMFTIQSQMYLTYHMQDAQVFYNREDLWQTAIEVRGSQETVVEPYFVIMNLPGEIESEFMLMLPLTPAGKDNMIAWLYADSDGADYGEMGVLKFSKQELIYGPRQIEARIDQDPTISQQLSLWNQRGSQVIRGNTMVIPVADGLIYVEPIFLQAESGRLPELKRVIVVHGSNIAMGESLSEALAAVFDRTGEQEIRTTDQEKVGTPDNVESLAKFAQDHFRAAQECLADGDWACYGREQDALQQILEELVNSTSP